MTKLTLSVIKIRQTNPPGNEAPSASDLRTIIESVGVGFDDEQASTVVDKLAGKSIDELIAAGAAQVGHLILGLTLDLILGSSFVCE